MTRSPSRLRRRSVALFAAGILLLCAMQIQQAIAQHEPLSLRPPFHLQPARGMTGPQRVPSVPPWDAPILISETFGSSYLPIIGPSGTGWHHLVGDGATNDKLLWGRVATGPHPDSAWSVGLNLDGPSFNPATDYYTKSMETLLVYGPLNLTDYSSAMISTTYFLDVAAGDELGVVISTDGTNFDMLSSESSRDPTLAVPRTSSYDLSSFTRQGYVWVGYYFKSNDDDAIGRGAFIDDIVIRGELQSRLYLPVVRNDQAAIPPSLSKALYLSLATNLNIGGVATSNEDILWFDGSTWAMLFDGSAVGLTSTLALDAFYVVNADTILMSFDDPFTLGSLTVDSFDIVQFDATSLGVNTAGSFSLYFDGNDVGLETAAENIDAIDRLPDGRLLVSTTGNAGAPGVSAADEDVLAFTPTTLGANTSGVWAMYFDGSDVGLGDSAEDIDAIDVTVSGSIYLSTEDVFAVPGVSGADEDVFVCTPSSLGNVTACAFSPILYFDGSTWGLEANDVDAINLPISISPPLSPTPTATATPSQPPTATPTSTPTSTPTATPTRTATATPTRTNTSTVTPTPTATPTPSNQPLYLSLSGGGTVGGVTAEDVDILYFNGTSWAMLFDASDVGVASSAQNLEAFYMLDADTILMSFEDPLTLGSLTVDSFDIVQFDATSLGVNTAGSFSLYFDGSDVGLDTTAENIDAIDRLPDGRLLISTTGLAGVPGASAANEDLLAFTPTTLGANTSGVWAMYFDGSDVGLGDSAEDIDAVDVTISGSIYLSTGDVFAVPGVSGADEDVFVCTPSSLGNVTACAFSPVLYFDGSTWGLEANDVDAINLPIDFSPTPTPTPTATSTPTNTPTATATSTPTNTPTTTPTATSTPTPTPTPTNTPTAAPTDTPTDTPTPTPTDTATSTPTDTATPTETPTSTPTDTPTPTPTDTPVSSGRTLFLSSSESGAVGSVTAQAADVLDILEDMLLEKLRLFDFWPRS